MKKIIKTAIGISSLVFISSATIGGIVSCSNNEPSVQTNNNSTNNTLYEQNAKIISSLLPAVLPKTMMIELQSAYYQLQVQPNN